ncbi:hypothetical protein AgCh_007400 [Apium graveolens]
MVVREVKFGKELEYIQMHQTTTVQGRYMTEVQSMEMEGNIRDNLGENGGIRMMSRNQDDGIGVISFSNPKRGNLGGNQGDMDIVVIDPKRRRVDNLSNVGDNLEDISDEPMFKKWDKKIARDMSYDIGPPRTMSFLT